MFLISSDVNPKNFFLTGHQVAYFCSTAYRQENKNWLSSFVRNTTLDDYRLSQLLIQSLARLIRSQKKSSKYQNNQRSKLSGTRLDNSKAIPEGSRRHVNTGYGCSTRAPTTTIYQTQQVPITTWTASVIWTSIYQNIAKLLNPTGKFSFSRTGQRRFGFGMCNKSKYFRSKTQFYSKP